MVSRWPFPAGLTENTPKASLRDVLFRGRDGYSSVAAWVFVLMVRTANIGQAPTIGLESGDDIAARHSNKYTHDAHAVNGSVMLGSLLPQLDRAGWQMALRK